MQSIEETLSEWRKQEFQKALSMFENAIKATVQEKDIVKQNEAASYFNCSVNTLKEWVRQGAPEIRLENGNPMYSKKSITTWLLQHQK